MHRRGTALFLSLAWCIAVAGPVAAGRGDLDPTFGTACVVTTAIGGTPFIGLGGRFVDPDGSILVVGAADFTPQGRRVFLARYTPDGAPDASFGTAGVVVTAVDAASLGCVHTAVRQADGRILVACDPYGASPPQPTVVRLEPDGDVDPTFASGGILTPAQTIERLAGIAVRPDGRIVVAGANPSAATRSVVFLQYDPDGTPDATFGTDGVVVDGSSGFAFESSQIIPRLALDPNGRMVLGETGVGPFDPLVIARYGADGAQDTTFGSGGTSTGVAASLLDDVGVQPDGKILGVATERVFRLLPDGSFDPGFGSKTRSPRTA